MVTHLRLLRSPMIQPSGLDSSTNRYVVLLHCPSTWLGQFHLPLRRSLHSPSTWLGQFHLPLRRSPTLSIALAWTVPLTVTSFYYIVHQPGLNSSTYRYVTPLHCQSPWLGLFHLPLRCSTTLSIDLA